MGRQRKTDSPFLACSKMNWNRSIEWEFETKSTLANKVDLEMQHVITICDYGTCPTIKSNNAINMIFVVKFGGNLCSSEALDLVRCVLVVCESEDIFSPNSQLRGFGNPDY